MNAESHSIRYGSREIGFALVWVRRARLAIAVEPDGSVRVRAPIDASLPSVLRTVRKKASWILRQQHSFDLYRPRTPERRYVGGESHLLLGRRYRLRIEASGDGPGARVGGGYLYLRCEKDAPTAHRRAILRLWYREQAQKMFPQRLASCLDHRCFRALDPPTLIIRRLKRRWGSLAPTGRLVLNTDLVRAPKHCIDYVIIHELCHAVVPNHSSAFYALLGKVLPGWQGLKEELEHRLA